MPILRKEVRAKKSGGYLLAVLLLAVPVWASLGQSMDSVISDQQHLRGELRSANRDGYTVHTISSPDGTVVKEYLSPNGVVFGISWQGPTLPSLTTLLGPYFSEFQQAASGSTRRRVLNIRTEHLIVESGGHMRAFHGRAYVPALVPGNLAATVVQ